MTSTLLAGGQVLHDGAIRALDVVVRDGVFAWIGAPGDAPDTDRTVELDGAHLLPAFVDGHVHTTDTGLMLAGLDLTGTRSKQDVLDLLAERTRTLRGRTILGHGWDETTWPVRELPTAAELDRASYGSLVYLSRVDVHSALVSGAMLASTREAEGLEGWSADGWVRREAHNAIRGTALGSVTGSQTAEVQRLALRSAAAHGIAAVHEMAGPQISGEADAASLLAVSRTEALPEVVVYWGQLASTGGLEVMRRLGAYGAAGDLSVDGAIGSRTACLRHAYHDEDTTGALYIDAESIADHLVTCSREGVQAGFHVIGDGAMDAIVAGLRAAARDVGLDAVRALRHRLEHAEMCDADAVAALAEHGVIASVQPAFDAFWGGTDGMYVDRLGPERGPSLNPYADLHTAGVPLVLGSDSPVTPFDPWGGVRGALLHRTERQRIGLAAAFDAHTRAGHDSVGDRESGVVAVGAPATYAIWAAALVDDDGWPDLTTGHTPTCLRTVLRGRVLHDAGALEEVAA
ncbi:MAG: amidohydrolase [Candidatus Nanopelagicales bacterium]